MNDQPTKDKYIKLTEAPACIINNPTCGACLIKVEYEDETWLCPSCGTLWWYDSAEDPGLLYEVWSDETLNGPPLDGDIKKWSWSAYVERWNLAHRRVYEEVPPRPEGFDYMEDPTCSNYNCPDCHPRTEG